MDERHQTIIVLSAIAVFTLILLILHRVLTHVFRISPVSLQVPMSKPEASNSVPPIPAESERTEPSLETGNEYPNSVTNPQWDQGDHGIQWSPSPTGITSPPPLDSYNFPAHPELTEEGTTVPAAFESYLNSKWQARY